MKPTPTLVLTVLVGLSFVGSSIIPVSAIAQTIDDKGKKGPIKHERGKAMEEKKAEAKTEKKEKK